MATIYAKTGSQYIFATRSWNDPNTWDGGIVPTASDDVIIAGETAGNTTYPGYTTENYYQGGNKHPQGIGYWSGKTVLKLYIGTGSISSQSGSVFSYTSLGELIKIDYDNLYQGPSTYLGDGTGAGTSALLGASVDTSFSPWTSETYPRTGSVGMSGFFNIYYTRADVPSGVIRLTGSETASFNTLTIHSGSKVHLTDQAQLNIYGRVYVYRGELKTSGSCMLNFSKHYTGSAGLTQNNDIYHQFISVLNDAGSKFSMEGPEVRSNTTLTSPAAVGDNYVTVASTAGFAEGDHIFVGEKNIEPTIPSPSGSALFTPSIKLNTLSSTDEAFIVAATGSNSLYVARVSALDAPVVFTASATEIIVDDERYGAGDQVIVNGQTASILAVEDYTYILKDYDFSGSMTQTDLENEFFTNHNEQEYYWNPFTGNWKIEPGKGLVLDTYFSTQINGLTNPYIYAYDYQYVNPSRIYIKDIYERNTKVEVWINNNYLVEDTGSIFKNTPLQLYATQSTAFIFTQVDPSRRYSGYWYYDYSCALKTTFFRDKTSSNTVNPNFYFKAQRQRYIKSTGVHLPKVDPNYLYDTHKYTIDYYKGEYQLYFDDKLIQTQADTTLGPAKGLVGVGLQPVVAANRYRNWTVIPRMRVSVTKQKLTLSNAVTGVTPGQKVYQSGVEFSHSTGNQVIKLQSFITEPLDFDNLFYSTRGYSDFAGDSITPVLRYFYDNFDDDLAKGIIKNSIRMDPALAHPLMPGVVGQALSAYNYSIESTQNNRTIRSSSAIFDLGTERAFNTVGWMDAWGGSSNSVTPIKYTIPIEISGSNDLDNWTPITSSTDTRDSLVWQAFRDYAFPEQTFRYIAVKVPKNNANQNWRPYGFRVLNNQSNRVQVNNASDFNIGDTVAILNQQTGYSEYYPSGYTGNVYPYVQAGSGSQDVIGDLRGREYTILDKTDNIITLDRPFVHGHLMKGDSVIKINRASEIRGSYESGSWCTGRLLFGVHSTLSPTSYEGRSDTEARLENIGLRNFSNMFPTWGNNSRYPIYMASTPCSTGFRFLGISYYGGPVDNYRPYIYYTDDYHIRHSYLGVYAGQLGFPYQSYYPTNTVNFSFMRFLPKISTGNIGNFSVDTYGTAVKSVQMYNQMYNSLMIYNYGMSTSTPNNYRWITNRHLINYRNKSFGALYSSVHPPYTPNEGFPTYYQYYGVPNVSNNQKIGASAFRGDPFYDGGNISYELYPTKNVLYENKYLHQQENINDGNYSAFNLTVSYYRGWQYATGKATVMLENFNNWGVNYYQTQGYVVRKKQTEDHYRYYGLYTNNSQLPAYIWNEQAGLSNMGAMCAARISSLSPTTSSFTVSFSYRADAYHKYSSRDGFGNLTGSWWEAIQTLEDTDPIYRTEYPGGRVGSWQSTNSTRLSGYAYLAFINNQVLEHIEALPPNTDFTTITRTFNFSGEGDVEVYLMADSIQGFYDLKGMSSVLETADPENVIIRANTFDEQVAFGKASTNLKNYQHLIKDTTKAGKFRLKSARLG